MPSTEEASQCPLTQGGKKDCIITDIMEEEITL